MWMDLETVIQSEVSQTEKEKYDIPGIWHLKRNDTNILTDKMNRLRKWTYGCQGEGTVKDSGKVMYTLLYLKWIINKTLQSSTRNSAQCHAAARMGGELGREQTHVRLRPPLFTWNCHNTVNRLYPNTKCFLGLKKRCGTCARVHTHTHTHTHTEEYYSAIKRNETGSFVEMWMDLETVTEWSQENKYHINAYMWNLDKWYRWSYLQSRNRDTDIENKPMGIEWGKKGWWMN